MRKTLSNVAKLGAIKLFLRDNGPEAALKSILDAHLLQSTLAEALHSGQLAVAGSDDPEQVAGIVLDQLREILSEKEF